MKSNGNGVGRVWGWGALGLVLSACSAIHHDCAERRDCPGPDPIDIGTDDDWWNTGNAGQANDAPEPSAGSGGDGEAGAGGEAGFAERDLTARIVHVSPEDGARGVASDAHIVIDFAEPMATVACEAAYQSSDLPAAALDFEWNEAGTRLTLTPRTPLSYATATVAGDLAFSARSYHFGFGAGGLTRTGQPLSAVSFGFSTLRRVSLTLPADPERTGNWTDGKGEGIHNCLRRPASPFEPTVCIGDDPSNVRYDGFVSFDLSALPAPIAVVSSARLVAGAALHGAPDLLGQSRIEHLAFAQLDAEARTVPALATLGPLFANSLSGKSEIDLSLDLTAAVADDYAHRSIRANRTQYRLGFTQVVPNGHWDDIELPTSRIQLALSYLIP